MGKVGQWLQVGANVGILAGLVLVGLQLQQNSDLTRGALFSAHFDSWIVVDQSSLGENFANTLAKAVSEPERLTDAEILEMQGYLRANVDQWIRQNALYDFGIFRENPEQSIHEEVDLVFGNRFAISWWKESREEFPQSIRAIIDQGIAQSQHLQEYDQRKLERIRENLKLDDVAG